MLLDHTSAFLILESFYLLRVFSGVFSFRYDNQVTTLVAGLLGLQLLSFWFDVSHDALAIFARMFAYIRFGSLVSISGSTMPATVSTTPIASLDPLKSSRSSNWPFAVTIPGIIPSIRQVRNYWQLAHA